MTQRILFGAFLGAVVAGSLLVACSAEAPPLYEAVSPPADTSAPLEPVVAEPIAISIPKIGAQSSLIPLGLTGVTKDCPDGGCLDVPPVDTPLQAGFYAGAKPNEPGDEVLPGQRGSAVVAAHVDGVIDGKKGQAGLFFKLHELVAGDEVFIDQADGGQLRFLVERVEQHDKDSFPTEAVYEADDMPRLNLITCGGVFDRAAGHYVANEIVFATLAPEQS